MYYQRIISIPVCIILCCAFLILGCGEEAEDEVPAEQPEATETVKDISFSFISALPHDTTSFTEGLFYHNGALYESTGAPQDMPSTRSLFGIVDLKTGKIDVKAELDKKIYFGEGIALLGDKIYQLTYTTRKGFIYDASSFRKIGEFTFPSREGWGMTTDSINLIMSDGTSTLTYLDPATLAVKRTLQVTDERGDVRYLNELEYIRGYIYANKYGTNIICKIDPATGKVVGRLDLSRLASEASARYPASLEMNGIAYDAASDKVFVTGKMWPYIFTISIPH